MWVPAVDPIPVCVRFLFMKFTELSAHLRKQKPDPVYWVSGGEEFFIEQAVQTIVQAVVSEEDRAFLVTRFDAEDGIMPAVIQARTIPFFMKRQAVILGNPERLSEEASVPLLEYCRKPAEETVLILSGEGVQDKKKWGQEIRKHATEVLCEPPKGKELSRWIVQRAEREGMRFPAETADQLLDLVGPGLRRLDMEIQKVGLFFRGKKEILPEDVCEVVAEIRLDSIFELVGAIGRKESARSTAILENLLRGGAEPLAILGMIARQVRILWKMKYHLSQGTGPKEVSENVGIPSFAFKEYQDQSSLFSSRELKKSLLALQRTDLELKSTDTPERLILEKLVFALTLSTPGRNAGSPQKRI